MLILVLMITNLFLPDRPEGLIFVFEGFPAVRKDFFPFLKASRPSGRTFFRF